MMRTGQAPNPAFMPRNTQGMDELKQLAIARIQARVPEGEFSALQRRFGDDGILAVMAEVAAQTGTKSTVSADDTPWYFWPIIAISYVPIIGDFLTALVFLGGSARESGTVRDPATAFARAVPGCLIGLAFLAIGLLSLLPIFCK